MEPCIRDQPFRVETGLVSERSFKGHGKWVVKVQLIRCLADKNNRRF